MEMEMTTREQIIAAAMENDLVQFYAIAFEAGRVAEREECAKVCDNLSSKWPVDDNMFDHCAESIRARNTK